MAEQRYSHIGQLTPDPRNARKHTPRNVGMVESALREVGAARSIVIDEDGVILAGNATVEAAAAAGIEKLQVVQADGNAIIAVQRSGLTAQQKTRLALYDNRAAELAEWDIETLADQQSVAADLFFDDELSALLEMPDISEIGDVSTSRGLGKQGVAVTVVFIVDQLAEIEAALRATGEINRAAALATVCKGYLESHAAKR